ncbi:MAG: GAF domain-containing protein [Armatimonadetes bacterium]|nr:GAF domain-containing protein [Armatimonadota bacterium]
MAEALTSSISEAKHAQRMEAVHRISIRMTECLDPDEVIEEVLDHSLELLEARHGSIMLLDLFDGVLTIKTARGLPEEVVRSVQVRPGEGIAGYVAQSGEPKVLPKGFKDRYSQTDEAADEMDAALCIPLKARNKVIGVLNLSGKTNGGDFSPEDSSLGRILASQAAVAIANATLYEATEQKMRELEALYNVALALTASSRQRDQVLREVLDRAIELLHARNGSLMLISEDGDYLDIVAANGLAEEVVAKVKPRLGKGIAGYVALSGQPKVLQRGFKDRYSETGARADAVKSSMCVPLTTTGITLGVLNLSDKRNGRDFDGDDLRLAMLLANLAAVVIEKATLYHNINEMFNDSIRALASAIDARDPYTEQHSKRVSEYSMIIAEELGLSEEQVDQIRIGSLLHDIGKIGVKEAVLLKPGRLTDDEFVEMKGHPVTSGNIMSPVRRFKDMLPILYHHHEAYSGRGYPHGLHGEDIPLHARIVAVADTFDAMTSDRPYRKGLPLEIALAEIKKNVGVQFDPKCAEAFLRAVEKGRIQLHK